MNFTVGKAPQREMVEVETPYWPEMSCEFCHDSLTVKCQNL